MKDLILRRCVRVLNRNIHCTVIPFFGTKQPDLLKSHIIHQRCEIISMQELILCFDDLVKFISIYKISIQRLQSIWFFIDLDGTDEQPSPYLFKIKKVLHMSKSHRKPHQKMLANNGERLTKWQHCWPSQQFVSDLKQSLPTCYPTLVVCNNMLCSIEVITDCSRFNERRSLWNKKKERTILR